MSSEDILEEAVQVRKELLAAQKSKDALLKALKVRRREGKEGSWVSTMCLGSSEGSCV